MKQRPIHPALAPFLEGQVILIDKPLHWTSFDAVKKIRILTQVAKVGHTGTLDPLATGLLIICTGKFTKKITHYMGMEKTYTGTLQVGATTPTYDLESKPENFKSYDHLSEATIQKTAALFTGSILQMPPIHSAIKKDGEKSYVLARKGINIKLEPRPVSIFSFDILSIHLPAIDFRVTCSTGTYIRSLAHDFGQALGTGAYLTQLRRTDIGQFSVEAAMSPAQFEAQVEAMKSASEGQPNT